ncbi:MAG: hypothetical protein QNL62_00780 [Gammaproteobacteria bacterium]|nr:hypothetical protein [Gammaproteobacteria bacterium]
MCPTAASTSANPDLDWSQLKETILMLNLAIAQIEQSMHEGNSSVDTLASSFTTLASNLNLIQSSVEQIGSSENTLNDNIWPTIQNATTTAKEKVQSAIIAFQFYDKLTQRLDHVSHSLTALTELIAEPTSLYSPPQWHALQESIRSKYTMEEERRMFDKVMSGASIEEALAEFKQEISSDKQDDGIELF